MTKAELIKQIKNRVATLDKRLMLNQIKATLDHAIKTIDAKMNEGDRWITTESGSHILLDKEGTIKGGAGGKFNGKHVSSMSGTKKFTKYETVKEREVKQQPATKKPTQEATPQPASSEQGRQVRLATKEQHDKAVSEAKTPEEKANARKHRDLFKAQEKYKNEFNEISSMNDEQFENYKQKTAPTGMARKLAPAHLAKTKQQILDGLKLSHENSIKNIEQEYFIPEKATVLQSKTLPKLNGTEKQIAYAENIRKAALDYYKSIPKPEEATPQQSAQSKAVWGEIGRKGVLQQLLEVNNASDIIENKDWKSILFSK